MKNTYPRGSEWRKWDLHVHAPNDKLNDGYKNTDGSDILDKFCLELENSDVQAFGITDYFSYDSFAKLIDHFTKQFPKSKKRFFYNLELRLNETVNKVLEEVNVHLIFNPNSNDKVLKFLSKLEVVKTGSNDTPIVCTDLTTNSDFAAATVTRDAIRRAFEGTFGKKAQRQEHFLVVTAANNDGLRPERGKKRKAAISDEIDKFSDAFLGSKQNVNYFLNNHRYEDKQPANKKPVICGSDSHSFDDLKNFLGKQFKTEEIVDGITLETLVKDICWVKADLTYEGLLQTIYEPESGERVFIGPLMPDRKDGFKVIRKIKFPTSSIFPEEIEFNSNLCSIIGSRSSGKSALLAYIAHSINAGLVESLKKGPGEGEDYHWSKIKFPYHIEWYNGKSNSESQGSVVYIPQDYLFKRSEDSNDIKDKIKPVMFAILPDFKREYNATKDNIQEINNKVAEEVDSWFSVKNNIQDTEKQLNELGDKKSIEKHNEINQNKIDTLKKQYSLGQDELQKYQLANKKISEINGRMGVINSELELLVSASKEKDYFDAVDISLHPQVITLPNNLRKIVNTHLTEIKSSILETSSKKVLDYKEKLVKENVDLTDEISKIRSENASILEKYHKNTELQQLVNDQNEKIEILEKIKHLSKVKLIQLTDLKSHEDLISEYVLKRYELIKQLQRSIKRLDQSKNKITFGVEYGFDDSSLVTLSSGLNARDKTKFVKDNRVQVDTIRNEPQKFLSDIYDGKQKVNSKYDKKEIAKEAFTLSEKILFTAEMEGDKIGGFTETTMTPGKRALFALRLILEESNDTWPLLIDQPEDDLDSRSVYDEVVPFLKEKKKERQIIMVSHNANLVLGADSEQLIIANRHGSDRKNEDGKQFNYLTGSLEFSQDFDEVCKDTLNSQGTCEHACEILDGGKAAFESRKNKYQIH